MFKQIFVFVSIFYITVYSQNDCDGIIGAAQDSSYIVSIYLKENVAASGGAKGSWSNTGSIVGGLGVATKVSESAKIDSATNVAAKISESAKIDSATNVAAKTSNSVGKRKVHTDDELKSISWKY